MNIFTQQLTSLAFVIFQFCFFSSFQYLPNSECPGLAVNIPSVVLGILESEAFQTTHYLRNLQLFMT